MNHAWMIDDDEEMAQAMKMMLKLLGFELRIFKNAPVGPERCWRTNCPPCSFWT